MFLDHYKGLNNKWNNGQIYCSKITKILLLNKFPKLDKDNIISKQPFLLTNIISFILKQRAHNIP